MNKRIIDVAGSSLPPRVQKMLLCFQANFGEVDYTITHYRDDVVSVQVNGLCDAYSVARFIQNTPEVYLELEACTYHYWTVRMTCNERVQARELPARRAWAQRPPAEDERRRLERISNFILDEVGQPRLDLTPEQERGNRENLGKLQVELRAMAADGRATMEEIRLLIAHVECLHLALDISREILPEVRQ